MRQKKVFHAVISAMLTLSLAVPAVSLGAVPAAADEAAKPIAVYDFEDGLRWFYDNDKDNFEIVSSGTLVVKKEGEQIEEGKDLVDANGFLYQGSGDSAHYALQQVSNQPVCAYDEERGTVFNLCKTYKVESLKKDKSATIAGDDKATAALDAALKVGDEVRKEATYKSAITCSNPFAKLDQAGAVLAFWGKASADKEMTDKTAFLEFDKDTTAVSFCFDTASAASDVKAGEWHYYTYVISAEKIDTYIDGKAAEGMTTIDGEAPADYIAFLKEAKIYLGATNLSTVETHEATRLDNVSFYNCSMTAEEVAALYEAETATTSVDVTKPAKFIAMDSEENFTSMDDKAPGEVKDFNIKGHTVKGVAVAENAKQSTKSGIKLSENPFAGNRLTGASISFWLHNNVTARKANAGKTTLDDSYVLSFINKEKYVFNPKEEDKSQNDITTFNFKTSMAFNFKEGALTDIGTGNQYSGLADETASAKFLEDSGDWHFITLNINNNGVTPYYDGVKVEGYLRGQGNRFMDGYYVRYGTDGSTEKGDLYNPVKLNGMFGGDNNQRATAMMAAFADADMDIYFGYFPKSLSLTEVGSPIDVTRISFYDAELTDTDVKALYDQEMAYINAQPEYKEAPQGKMGDLNGDENVTAADALVALQVAAKLTEETDAYHTYGDMNGDGSITAADALVMLQIAAKLVPES